MPKKLDTNGKLVSIILSSEEVLILEKVLHRYMLEQEALVYLDTKKIDAYSVYDKVKKIIGLLLCFITFGYIVLNNNMQQQLYL